MNERTEFTTCDLTGLGREARAGRPFQCVENSKVGGTPSGRNLPKLNCPATPTVPQSHFWPFTQYIPSKSQVLFWKTCSCLRRLLVLAAMNNLSSMEMRFPQGARLVASRLDINKMILAIQMTTCRCRSEPSLAQRKRARPLQIDHQSRQLRLFPNLSNPLCHLLLENLIDWSRCCHLLVGRRLQCRRRVQAAIPCLSTKGYRWKSCV